MVPKRLSFAVLAILAALLLAGLLRLPADAAPGAPGGRAEAAATQAWQTQVVKASQPIDGQSLALEQRGTPHIAYVASAPDSSTSGSLWYASPAGSSWTSTKIADEAVASPDMVIDWYDRPHVVYTRPHPAVMYATRGANGWGWATVDDGMAAGPTLAISAAFGQLNLHVAYQDVRPTNLPWARGVVYANWNGLAWNMTTVDKQIPGCGYDCDPVSIALDGLGRPHVVYRTAGSNQLRYSGPEGFTWWRTVVIDSAGLAPQVAVDAQNVPHVAYTRPGQAVMYATLAGGAWQRQIVDGDMVAGPSLALDAYGNPHLAYCDVRSSPPAGPGKGLKYAYRQGGRWQIEVVSPEKCQYASLAIDAAGTPRISYYAPLQQALKYAVRTATRATATVPAAGAVLTSPDDGTGYTFGPGTFDAAVVVTHTQRFAGSVPAHGDLLDIGHAFAVDAAYEATGEAAQPAPGQTYSLSVTYAGQDLGPVEESSLALYSWDGSAWVKEPGSAVDTAAHTVSASPGRFSLWIVLGEPRGTYLPLLTR